MIAKRRLMPVIGLITIVVGSYMSVRLSGQAPTQEPFDFSNAVFAEVRDARGQAILRGQFTTSDTDPNDTERKATLTPTGIDADASGEAEIEVSRSGNTRRQEIEFEVRNLQPGGVFTFVIDGRDFATVTADNRGRAEHERDIPLS
jgi:hypothetical protein